MLQGEEGRRREEGGREGDDQNARNMHVHYSADVLYGMISH